MTDLYKIKPLVWVEGKAGDGWRADTAYGWFNLFWSHERQEYRLLFAGAQGAIWHGSSDVDGRVFADQHYRQQLAQHLEPVPEVVTALEEAHSVIGSINRGYAHLGKNKPFGAGYLQTKDWCDWAMDEVLPKITATLAQVEKAGG